MKHRYNIVGLDCANCARKVEEHLSKNKKLKNVTVNFSTSKLSFYTETNITEQDINTLIKQIEPQAYITQKETEKPKQYHISLLIISALLGILGTYINKPIILKNILIISAYILLLYKPLINSYKTLINTKTINENTLITISSLGALIIGKTSEGIMVAFLYILGKLLEEKAINTSTTSIKKLIEIKQDYANLKHKTTINKIDISKVKQNDILIVKKGEKVPVDGIITKGTAELDMSMLTGETEKYHLEKGKEVLSGAINQGEVFEIKATKPYATSTVAKILELTLSASDKKAKTETIVTKFSKIYTPTVLLLSLLVTITLPLFNIPLSESIYRGLTFLVISCPCAIAISVPLSYFTALGVSSKNGILIKGSNYLDNLVNLKKIIFDKTGTLTTGTFKVTNLEITDKKYTKEEIIKILAHGESLSNHPIAKSITSMYKETIESNLVKDFKEETGKGISYKYEDKKIKVGTKSICKNCNINTNIHVSINNKHICSITLDDGIKENAKQVIKKLKKQNIETIMFTGDKKEPSQEIAKRLGINVKYEMLPEDKFRAYEKESKNTLTAFVGDGINDTPVLKRADIGISMGQVGSTSAIEASDIVIMNDDLNKITKSIEISKYTNNIIKQNLIFAIGIKVLILILSILGLTTMWLAVFADTGVTLITILNTLRIKHKFK